jgi:hypothetical protein
MGSDEDARCFLVAPRLGQDLLFCAKHLFVAASEEAKSAPVAEAPQSQCGAAKRDCCTVDKSGPGPRISSGSRADTRNGSEEQFFGADEQIR